MTFDLNISDNVSLSKILDVFIIENEDPYLIISFLKQHESEFEDIFKYSLYCDRIFQLDFFLSCNQDDAEYIIKKFNNTTLTNSMLLTWQILKSNSRKAQHAKYFLRQDLKQILNNNLRHPYSSGHERYIAQLDSYCFRLSETNKISELPLLVDNRKLEQYFKYIEYSLFQNRIIQYDFFANLDEIAKYLMIKTAFARCNITAVKRLAMQIFDSDESIEVKKCCYDSLYTRITPIDILDKNTQNIVYNCSSFAELMLKMTIFNESVSQTVALYLLLFKPKWICEWVNYDKDELNSYLKISELVDKLFNYAEVQFKYAS